MPMTPHTVQHAIRDLIQEVNSGRRAKSDAIVQAASWIQGALACNWVSFGKISGTAGERVLVRWLAYHRSGAIVNTPRATPEQNGGYFAPLIDRGFYACQDMQAEPAFHHLVESYLRPNGIRALMSAAIPAGRTGLDWFTLTAVNDRPTRWLATEVTALRRCALALRRTAEACGPGCPVIPSARPSEPSPAG